MFQKLTKQDWKEIKILLKSKDRNITQIARNYGISRNSVYAYARRRNWIKREIPQDIPKKSFLKRLFEKITQ
jgi:hypothetical protein